MLFRNMPHLEQVNSASNLVSLDERLAVLFELAPVGLHASAPEPVSENIGPQVKVGALRCPTEPAKTLVIHSSLHRKRRRRTSSTVACVLIDLGKGKSVDFYFVLRETIFCFAWSLVSLYGLRQSHTVVVRHTFPSVQRSTFTYRG